MLERRYIFGSRSQIFYSYCCCMLCCVFPSFFESNNIRNNFVQGFGYYLFYTISSARNKRLQSSVFHTRRSRHSYHYPIIRQSSSLVFSTKTDSLSVTPLTKSTLSNHLENEKVLPITATSSAKTKKFKWVIVGGGIHGVHVAVRLISGGVVQKLSSSSVSSQRHEKQQRKQRQQRNNYISSNEICIIDNHQTLLHAWKVRAKNTGMKYLRSSGGYHLDVAEDSLRRHQLKKDVYQERHHTPLKLLMVDQPQEKDKVNTSGKKNTMIEKNEKRRRKKKKNNHDHNNKRLQSRKGSTSQKKKENYNFFSKDYKRPRLDVFNNHCDSVIKKYNLDKIHMQGEVVKIKRITTMEKTFYEIQIFSQQNRKQEGLDEVMKPEEIKLHADNVVLALGNDQAEYPDWVDKDYDVIKKGVVRHLLDVDIDNKNEKSYENSPYSNDWKFLYQNDGIIADTNDQAINTSKNKPDIDNKRKIRSGNERNHHNVAVIGSGITAAHKVLELFSETHKKNYSNRTIHLLSIRPLKEQQFDTHQDWMMDRAASERSIQGGGYGFSKRRVTFQNCDSYQERRKIIEKERVSGTITPAVNRGVGGLKYAIKKGYVKLHQAEVIQKRYVLNPMKNNCTLDGDGVTDDIMNPLLYKTYIELHLSNGERLQVNEIMLATGFGKNIPGGELTNDLIKTNKLNVSKYCGYPIVNEGLCWQSTKTTASENNMASGNLYVTGALAELELGPSARNIAGARLAAERILQHNLLYSK